MRLMNKKKQIAVFIILALLMVIGGWGKKKIELMTDGKLIDLEKAIPMSHIGDESANADNQTSGAEDAEQHKSTFEVSAVSTKTYKIRIHGTSIFFEGNECSIDELSKQLNAVCVTGDKIKLLDDYAETHIYHEVEDILKEKSDAIGIYYEAE